MKTISLMLDCSRNAVPNKEFLFTFIDMIKKCGFNQLQLYMEDTYKIDDEPFFGYFRGRYTREELKEIDDYAFSKGVEIVPAIQVLAHLATIFNWEAYAPLNDIGDCLLIEEEKTYELIDKMINQLSSTFRSNKINIGMDESFLSGKGEYLKRHGYKNPNEVFLYHLGRVSKILEKYNVQGMMWGDMFYRNMNNGSYYTKKPIVSEDTKKLIPNNINIIYWDYYNLDKEVIDAMAKSALLLDKNAYFAGGVWSWVGFMPKTDFAINQSKVSVPICMRAGIENFIATAWGDNGAECSKLATLPALFYFAKLANGESDDKVIRSEFEKEFNFKIDDLISLNKLNALEDNNEKITNVCKYMLYNDFLTGVYDNTVNEKKASLFKELKKNFDKFVQNAAFGYVFKTASELANVLDLKYNIGIRIRKAYKTKNLEEMNQIINDLSELEIRINSFYNAFKNQWYKENRLEGFEIQSHRIGGLILRLKEVKDLLNDFKDGRIGKISPLEQDILKMEDAEIGEDKFINSYALCSSVNTH